MSEGTKIVGVAIQYPGGLVCSARRPARHFHIIRKLCALGVDNATPEGCVQGFVTDAGEFVDRAEAGAIADANGQAHRTPGSSVGGPLFSEDLW